MDPTIPEIKLSNMLREKHDFLEQLLLGSTQFFINCYFYEFGMGMGMIKFSPILLIFYHKLVLREGIFGTAASLIPYFAIHKL